jgi:hypothetical protein
MNTSERVPIMKSAVHALSIVVFLLFSLAAFAAQSGQTSTSAATANPSVAQLQSALAARRASEHKLSSELFMPVPLSSIGGPNVHDRVQSMTAGYSSAVPLLSCIGAGMAIGGLVSVRLTRRLHR